MSLKIILSYDYPKEISQLLNEYTNMLIENDDSVKEILKVQNYDDELKHLKEKYGLANGRLYLAYYDEKLAGCIALRKIDDKNYILKENLMNKLEFNIVDNLLGKEKEIEKINKQIVEIISGEFTFDKQTRKYNYKKNGYNINVKNTANGIKTFGLIEMLLNNRRLNEKTILIIDEPEVHLHPNWQVKYAEILVILAMNLKVKILLNSHSPYFIDAIKIYS